MLDVTSRRTFLAYLAITPLLAACSPAPAPVATSAQDPSNPHAPEGAAGALSSNAPATGTAAHPAEQDHAGHVHGPASPASAGDAGAAVYVCPMHPEVTSTSPGVCPKCNMKLVPRK